MMSSVLTDQQRAHIRQSKGRATAQLLAKFYGVDERTIRREWNPPTRRTLDRKRKVARAKQATERTHTVNVRDRYQAKDCGAGRDARCPGCGRVYRQSDFETDAHGVVIEPTICWRCRT